MKFNGIYLTAMLFGLMQWSVYANDTTQPAQATTFDAATFASYLQQLPKAQQSAPVQQLVNSAVRGEGLTNQIIQGQDVPVTIANIKDIQAYLYAAAVQQGDTFVAGMTTVHDSTGNLNTYLQSIDTKYDRPSSHTDSKLQNQFGVDLPQDQQNLLNKNTLLIQQTSDDGSLLRVKSEYYGFNSLLDKIKHVISYITTRGEAAGGRKEHVPKDVIKKFVDELNNAGVTLTKEEGVLTSVQKAGGITIFGKNLFGSEIGGGIKEMLNLFTNKIGQAQAAGDTTTATALQKAQDNLTDYLTNTKGYDASTLQYRKGNEVVIDLNQKFKQSSPASDNDPLSGMLASSDGSQASSTGSTVSRQLAQQASDGTTKPAGSIEPDGRPGEEISPDVAV